MATRREFAKVVAAAALCGAAPMSGAHAQPAGDTPAAPLADALTHVVRAQSGKHLNADELKRIRKDFAEYGEYLEKFRAFSLTNADEPDLTFTALTKRWP